MTWSSFKRLRISACLQPHFFALHGLSKLLETTALVGRRINPGLRVSGVVVCLYDGATRLAVVQAEGSAPLTIQAIAERLAQDA